MLFRIYGRNSGNVFEWINGEASIHCHYRGVEKQKRSDSCLAESYMQL